jgi:hypothetical protein
MRHVVIYQGSGCGFSFSRMTLPSETSALTEPMSICRKIYQLFTNVPSFSLLIKIKKGRKFETHLFRQSLTSCQLILKKLFRLKVLRKDRTNSSCETGCHLLIFYQLSGIDCSLKQKKHSYFFRDIEHKNCLRGHR